MRHITRRGKVSASAFFGVPKALVLNREIIWGRGKGMHSY
jgi:hypothetical protein